jgi:hypothetical protein
VIGDLPDLDTFFGDNSGKKRSLLDEEDGGEIHESGISIYISKEKDKWIQAEFLDIAVAGIGIHVRLPIQIDLTSAELSTVSIKFVRRKDDIEEVLKEAPVMVRWQEHDELTGNLKLGLHFHGELKHDKVLVDILRQFKS